MTDPGSAARVTEVLALVMSAGPRAVWPEGVVTHCQTAVGAAGVGLTLADASGPIGVAATTPGLAQAGEDLQLTLGEGPCHDAVDTGRVVRVPDLAGDGRWLLYAPEAAAAGIAAQVSVPLTVGAVRVGVLSAYLNQQGDLGNTASATLNVYAEAATRVLLLDQQDAVGLDPVGEVMGRVDIRPVVHQAVGRVAVQLRTDLPTALLRLRVHAFATGRSLRAVAADVGARRLVFTDDTPGGVIHPPAPGGQPPDRDQPSPRTTDDVADT